MSIRRYILKSFTKYKDKSALFVDNSLYTYKELSYGAGRFANALIQNGFSGNQPVIIMGMRSYGTYAAITGILAAGGIYVPTNPSFPSDRNLKIISRSEAQYAYLDMKYINIYADVLEHSVPLLIFVEKSDDVKQLNLKYKQHKFCAVDCYPADFPEIDEMTDRYVYILFTSGSTGEPKGVAISSKNVENYIHASCLRHKHSSDDRFIQLFDLTFDLSAHVLFLGIISGASIYIPDDKSLINPIKFAQEHKITHWASVPTVLTILDKLRILKENMLPSIRYSMFCGEALPYELALRWSISAPNSIIENLYGPTEATIACTHYTFEPEHAKKYSINGLVPIGIPFEGTGRFIVDNNKQLINIGDTGELLLTGNQIADGYIKDSKQTEEKFIYINGIRCYRTGDIVKENEAGIVFLGRADTQIKLKGYRVELSEIENEVSKYTDTTGVVAVPTPLNALSYTGFVLFVSNNGQWDVSGLMRNLKETLPDYMNPSKIISIDDFPRNASGKIDRKKLSEMI